MGRRRSLVRTGIVYGALISSVAFLFGCGGSTQESASSASTGPIGIEKINFSYASPVKIKGGSPALVSWSFKSKQPKVLSAYLSADGGSTWTMIEPFVMNTGVYNLNAPLVDGTNFKLMVKDSLSEQVVAVSDPFEMDSVGPVLDPGSFVAPTTISIEEFTTYATKIDDVVQDTWTIDFTNYVNETDFRTFALVNASQYGGPVTCSNKMCVYGVPNTVQNLDTFSIYLEDAVGNITGPIVISMNPNYVAPPSSGGGGGGGGGTPPPATPFTPPTLIPLASITDGGLGATDPAVYCPKTSEDTSLTPVVRICGPSNNWSGCTHKASTLDLPKSYFATIAAGTRVEIVYDTLTTAANNTWNACDFPVNANNLTIVGVCGRPIMTGINCSMYSGALKMEKALFVNNGENTRFVNLEFRNMQVSSHNGAGIRNQGKDLVVSHSYFHSGEQGILGGGGESGYMLVQKSKFQKLGYNGYEHTIYASDRLSHVVIKNSVFARTRYGHELKSRAQQTTVQCSAFTSRKSTNAASFDSTSSYLINFPQGGKVLVEDSVFSDGESTSNPHVMSYGDEGGSNLDYRNYYQDFTFRNNRVMVHKSNAIFMLYRSYDVGDTHLASSFSISGNTIAGLGATYTQSKFFSKISGADLSVDLSVTNTIAADPAAEFPTRDPDEDMPYPSSLACPDFSYSSFPNN